MSARYIKTKPNSKTLIAVKTPTYQKKICKFFFTGKDTSIYICFYFKAKEYFYGKKEFMSGDKELSFNFTRNKLSKKCPKLSYHESGEVHFKVDNQKESLEKVKISPLKDWNGELMATITIKGFNGFEDYYDSKERKDLIIEFQKDIEGLKLTIWATAGKVELDKFGKRYNFGFTLGRVNPPRLINFGIKVDDQTSYSNNKLSSLTVITGWDKSAVDIGRLTPFLYLHSEI